MSLDNISGGWGCAILIMILAIPFCLGFCMGVHGGWMCGYKEACADIMNGKSRCELRLNGKTMETTWHFIDDDPRSEHRRCFLVEIKKANVNTKTEVPTTEKGSAK